MVRVRAAGGCSRAAREHPQRVPRSDRGDGPSPPSNRQLGTTTRANNLTHDVEGSGHSKMGKQQARELGASVFNDSALGLFDPADADPREPVSFDDAKYSALAMRAEDDALSDLEAP